jgi:hypothetical protein
MGLTTRADTERRASPRRAIEHRAIAQPAAAPRRRPARRAWAGARRGRPRKDPDTMMGLAARRAIHEVHGIVEIIESGS